MSDKKYLLEEQGGRFLRPRSVGSAIHWHVEVLNETIDYGKNKGKRNTACYGSMRLTDCDTHIKWSFSSEDDLSKIDNAIVELKLARAALAKALKIKKSNANPEVDEDDDF